MFLGNRLRGIDSAGVENCHFVLTKPVAVNTGLALPRSAVRHISTKFEIDTTIRCLVTVFLLLIAYVSF